MADPDWTDPCAVLAWLRPLYYRIAAGQLSVEVEYASRYRLRNNQISAENVAGLMRQLETECARKNGSDTGRRRSFIAG